MGYKSKVKQRRRMENSVVVKKFPKPVKLRPDLGMALESLKYSEPLEIGCSSVMQMGDTQWDVSISGVLRSYGSIGDNPLPSLPLNSEGYLFTIAFNQGDGLSKSEVIARLQRGNLAVRIEPKYKYLTPNGWEWVLPLVPVT